MRLKKLRTLEICLILYIVLTVLVIESIDYIFVFLLILCGLSYLVFKKKSVIILTPLIFLAVLQLEHLHINRIESHQNCINGNISMVARIVSDPNIISSYQQKFTIQPERIESKKRGCKKIPGLSRVSMQSSRNFIRGDTIFVSGKFSNIEKSEVNYYFHNLAHSIYTESESVKVDKYDVIEENIILSHINNLRQQIRIMIRSKLNEPHASLLIGMLIGSRENFSYEFETALRNTGTNHIIAVSGYNITLLILSLTTFSGFISRKVINYIVVVIIMLYLLIVGIDNYPALRAGLMGLIVLVGLTRGRRVNILTTIIFVVSIMMFINPFIYRSISFQLSFLSTFGLMFFTEKVGRVFPKIVPSLFREELATTISATIATLPITWLYFGQVSLVSVIVNGILGPIVSLITILGLVVLVISLISPSLTDLVIYLNWAILDYMVFIIEYFSSLPNIIISK